MSARRFVVIGAGANIFSAHRRGLSAIDGKVVGVYDVNAERARLVGEEFDCPVFSEVDSLLGVAADVAIILAPHPYHAELAIAGVRAGKHVLTEKPLSIALAEGERMVAEAEKHDRLLAVAFQHRARAEVREARRMIQEGEIGTIQRADVLATWPRRYTYFQVAPWRGTWQGEGGGVLINQGQHDLDLLGYLVGRPSKVVGWTRTRRHPIETEDTAEAMVEWPNGAMGAIHISTAEIDETQRIEITGTAGRLRLLPGRLEVWRNEVAFDEFAASPGNPFAPPTTTALPTFLGGDGGHEAIYRNLAEALAGREALIASGRDALVTLELANAIVYSSHVGRPIDLPLDAAAFSGLLASRRAFGRS